MASVTKSFVVSKKGSLSNLQYRESNIPTLESNKVLVEVKSIGLNYADLFAIMGLYSATPKGEFIPGLEYSGVVAESKDTRFAAGDKVIGVTRFGGYTSHIIADPNYLSPLPYAWTFQEGAAFPVQTLTAYYALVSLADIKPDYTLPIHSSAGGVGLQANRIAKKFQAFTVGVVGHASKVNVLQEEGFDRVIIRGPDFRQQLQEALGGRELNTVLETTGNKYFRYSYDAMAPMGRLISFGSAHFTPAHDRPNYLTLIWKYLTRPKIDPLSMIPANKAVMGFNLIWLYERLELLRKLLKEINGLDLPPPRIGHEFEFDSLPEALRFFKVGKSIGKIIINVN